MPALGGGAWLGSHLQQMPSGKPAQDAHNWTVGWLNFAACRPHGYDAAHRRACWECRAVDAACWVQHLVWHPALTILYSTPPTLAPGGSSRCRRCMQQGQVRVGQVRVGQVNPRKAGGKHVLGPTKLLGQPSTGAAASAVLLPPFDSIQPPTGWHSSSKHTDTASVARSWSLSVGW